MNRYVSAFAVVAALVPGLACSKTSRPPPSGDFGGTGGNNGGGGLGAGSGGASGSGGKTVGDAGGDAANDSGKSTGGSGGTTESGDSGCVPGPSSTTPPGDVGSAVCSPTKAWGAPSGVPTASSGGPDTFASVTFDELTIVWLSESGGVPVIHYADRAVATDDFAPYATINPGSGYFAAERPAVSADGERIVVVRTDGKAFAEFTRVGRFSSFTDTPSEDAYSPINLQGRMLVSTERYGDPILSADDLTFYYSRYGSGQQQTIAASTRAADVAWQVGTPLNGTQLYGYCGKRREPTGISSDGLTLFYFDETDELEHATWRKSPADDFAGTVAIGDRPHAQPNAACSALYYSVVGDGGVEHIAVAK